MKLKKSTLLKFDTSWCGNHQVPASLLLKVSGQSSLAQSLARLRSYLAVSLVGELLGYFLITLGLLTHRPLWIFLTGIVLKTGGELIGAFLQNKSGTFLSIELQKYLRKVSTHSIEIRSILADKGCSESEINAIQSLSSDVYQAELNGYQRSRVLNIGTPLACSFALLMNGDIITAIIVAALGALSFPIGERFFKENIFRKESELRLGQAAQLLPYIEKIYKDHVRLTVKVNFLSQLPLLLFAFRFLWNGTGQLLSSFFGLTQGLMGLTGTLAFQKSRAAAIRTTATASHLIDALSSPHLIVTSRRWEEHCLVEAQKGKSEIHDLQNGFIFQNFCPLVPLQEKAVFSVSCEIPMGAICLLRAPSGKGKSTFLAALTHLIEHTGDLMLAINGQYVNVHTLSREEFDRKIFFFREDNVDKSARLVDLFKSITYQGCEDCLKNAQASFNPLLVDLAWKAPDNLIELEIKHMGEGKPSVFSNHMLDFLKNMREKQILLTRSMLQKAGGNLSTDRIYPERHFSTLSSGEKRRVTNLIALEACRTLEDISLVILDEPLAHLDEGNMHYQIQSIREMQKLPTSPAILLISHHFVNEIKEKLMRVQELNFDA
jgi:ABC-type multidrug transport system ATPase subunit